jgi:RNA-directed DNA polymerase
MSSGTSFPPPVRCLHSQEERRRDRIAQMVVRQLIEPDLDPIFLPDSYGHRPRKSALDAVGVTR